MTKTENEYTQQWAKKVKAIELKGGKCEKCGENDVKVLGFLHKEIHPDNIPIHDLKSYRWPIYKAEIEKCTLLCLNCIFEENSNELVNDKNQDKKKLCLEYLNTYRCVKCGHSDDLYRSLCFHHVDPTSKEFDMSSVINGNTNIDQEHIYKELDKCEVLCASCHMREDVNSHKFDQYREIIYKKANNLRERQGKLDRDLVFQMFDSGMSKSSIARTLNAAKSTISDIINHSNTRIVQQ